jgi:hypothetical protein
MRSMYRWNYSRGQGLVSRSRFAATMRLLPSTARYMVPRLCRHAQQLLQLEPAPPPLQVRSQCPAVPHLASVAVLVVIGFHAALAVRPEKHQLDARPVAVAVVAAHVRAAWTRRLLLLPNSQGRRSGRRAPGGEPHGARGRGRCGATSRGRVGERIDRIVFPLAVMVKYSYIFFTFKTILYSILFFSTK